MGHWAIHDQFFAIAGVGELEQKLAAAGVHHEFFRYDAKHAFANEEADAKNLPPLGYNAGAATLAWQRTMAFFAHNLR
jgi:carboxymethylenebutenolidase